MVIDYSENPEGVVKTPQIVPTAEENDRADAIVKEIDERMVSRGLSPTADGHVDPDYDTCFSPGRMNTPGFKAFIEKAKNRAKAPRDR